MKRTSWQPRPGSQREQIADLLESGHEVATIAKTLKIKSDGVIYGVRNLMYGPKKPKKVKANGKAAPKPKLMIETVIPASGGDIRLLVPQDLVGACVTAIIKVIQ